MKKQNINKAVAFLKGEQIIKYQKDIAKAMNADITTVSQALNGNENYLTDKFISRFCEAFPIISGSWLLTGEGEMIKVDYPAPNPPLNMVKEPYVEYVAAEGGTIFEGAYIANSGTTPQNDTDMTLTEIIGIMKSQVRQVDQLIMQHGQLIDHNGQLISHNRQLITDNGKLIANNSRLITQVEESTTFIKTLIKKIEGQVAPKKRNIG